MHLCLEVDEILRILACELVASGTHATAVALACSCKTFEDPVLDALWKTQDQLLPLLKSLPRDIWKIEAGQFSFNRIPTKAEWCRFRKYASRMRGLEVDTLRDLITSDVLLALQLRTGNNPLFPRLETLVCANVAEDIIPFIPLFLSPNTADIYVNFTPDSPMVLVALAITKIPILCPHIRHLILDVLPSDSAMTEAVSEVLLACNRDTLQAFCVTSPLTEEAFGVLYTLPRLHQLSTVMQGQTSLPPVTLPDLETMYLRWDSGRAWLQGFRGATIDKLKTVTFRPTTEHAEIGDFLEEFQSVALTTSVQHSLSEFCFFTTQSWTPNYQSLLIFTQMTRLEIEFSCHNGCSSTVDDDIVTNLAQAMPKLEILRLGEMPCGAITGITLKGLVALACHCPRLSKLCVHLRAGKLVEATTGPEPLSPPETAALIPWMNCALTDLQVGRTPIPQLRTTSAIALALLQIFPRIVNIEYTGPHWRSVRETIELFRQIGGHVYRASEMHLPHLQNGSQ